MPTIRARDKTVTSKINSSNNPCYCGDWDEVMSCIDYDFKTKGYSNVSANEDFVIWKCLQDLLASDFAKASAKILAYNMVENTLTLIPA